MKETCFPRMLTSSHCMAVVSLWAMKTEVRLLDNDFNAFRISASVVLSRALVASSHSLRKSNETKFIRHRWLREKRADISSAYVCSVVYVDLVQNNKSFRLLDVTIVFWLGSEIAGAHTAAFKLEFRYWTLEQAKLIIGVIRHGYAGWE